MSNISFKLINWYTENKRDLPWRKTTNPYEIWLSEIILQQTRVDQGLPYYEKFITTFPTVKHLAKASESEVLKLWQGLGYYSRARNLHSTAKFVVNELRGEFPSNYIGLLNLKGVGNYTAAAIASFCFNEKIAVIDGNVFRFLSRLYDIDIPINSSKGHNIFNSLANELISNEYPGMFNQAIMEFGALCCRPKQPNCEYCPFLMDCESFRKKTINERPVKIKNKTKKEIYFIYFYPLNSKKITLIKNQKKSIYQNMYEFPKIVFQTKEEFSLYLRKFQKNKISDLIFHQLSHLKITAVFVDSMELSMTVNGLVIDKEEMVNYPIPRLITKYLEIVGES